MKPLIKWSGGKKDEIKLFEKYIPPEYNTYLEPFFGGGSLYFHLCPQKAVVTDIHQDLIHFYNAIKNGHQQEISTFMNATPNDELNYYITRDKMVTDTPLKKAIQFYYLRKTCFRGMLRYNKKGKFNIPFGRYKCINYTDIQNTMYAQIMQNTQFLCNDFEHIFNGYNNKDNFMFLDPPYDSEFTDYGYCKFGKEEHVRLANCFKQTHIKCLMIIGETPFIKELYKDYIIDTYPKKYRFKIHSGRIGNEINTNHLVIANFT